MPSPTIQRTPIPLSIAVRNLFPPLVKSAPVSLDRSQKVKPGKEHETSLQLTPDLSSKDDVDEPQTASTIDETYNEEGSNKSENDMGQDLSVTDDKNVDSSDEADNFSDEDGDNNNGSYGDELNLANDLHAKNLSAVISSEDRCILVSHEVLVRLRLDIVIKNSISSPSDSEKEKAEASETTSEIDDLTQPQDVNNEDVCNEGEIEQLPEEKIVDSFVSHQCSAHPRWDHLNEQISILPNNPRKFNYNKEKVTGDSSNDAKHATNCSHSNIVVDTLEEWEKIYSNLYARFVILDDNSNLETDSPSTHAGLGNKKELVLTEIPLHPKNLRRLPNNNSASLGSASTRESNNGNNYNTSMLVPHSLPPNAILIHYTDGNTRVLPDLYRLLVQRGIISETAMSMMMSTMGSGDGSWKFDEDAGNKNDDSRFSEKAFDVLKGGPTQPAKEDVSVGAPSTEIDASNGLKASKDALHNAEGNNGSKENDPNSIFGDDKVFDLLGSASSSSPAALATSGSNVTSTTGQSIASTSVFDDSVFDLVGKPSKDSGKEMQQASLKVFSAGSDEKDPTSDIAPVNPDVSVPNGETNAIASSDDKVDNHVADEGQKHISNQTMCDTPSQPQIPLQHPQLESLPPLPPAHVLSKEENNVSRSCQLQTLKDEVEELRWKVHYEQWLMEQEQQQIYKDVNELRYIMNQVQQLQEETSDVQKEVGVERIKLFRSEYRLEALRIHLLQHLQIIFPIKLISVNAATSSHQQNQPQHHYFISGSPLPDDIHDLTFADDQVSTALGFTCHLIGLTSKYLAIPLRFRMVCRFSRSAIIDDPGRGGNVVNKGTTSSTTGVYPLFRERGVVDREQLDYAMVLLQRNAECLLHVRKVEFHKGWNILAKIDRLLLQIIEGDDPSFRQR